MRQKTGEWNGIKYVEGYDEERQQNFMHMVLDNRIVVMVAGNTANQGSDDAELARLLGIVLAETDRRTAVRIVTALSGRARNQVYQASLRLTDEPTGEK